MTEADKKPLRCAIYTRKSSEEGLQQAFNSLHAQREFCEAYVRSQAGEGWTLDREHYDDGGHSGGSLKRPALQRLLGDVTARRVDVVVVYKVDRLTRSLSDFAKLIEIFDKAKVSFVSVTQAFNTTNSMGRLTLNILLSFAQFEREVTGERIRDKIAASKARGIWMGGLVPLGYEKPVDPVTRALVLNPAEAETVRLIYRRFLEVRSIFALQTWADEEGVRSKRALTAGGRRIGGVKLTGGALTHILTNRTYLGEIPHKAVSYPGPHTAIIDRQTFDAVHETLAARSRRRRTRVTRADRQLLSGRVFDADGQLMTTAFGYGRQGHTYVYYVAPPPLPGVGGTDDDAIRRVPATAIEDLVKCRLALLAPTLTGVGIEPEVRSVVARVEIHPAAVHLLVRLRALANVTGEHVGLEKIRGRLGPTDRVVADPMRPGQLRIILPVRLKVRGGRTWAVGPGGLRIPKVRPPDMAAIKRLRIAHEMLWSCGSHPEAESDRLRHARAPKMTRQTELANWAFLAPDIQKSILMGAVGSDDVRQVLAKGRIPACWSDQRALIYGGRLPSAAPGPG